VFCVRSLKIKQKTRNSLVYYKTDTKIRPHVSHSDWILIQWGKSTVLLNNLQKIRLHNNHTTL